MNRQIIKPVYVLSLIVLASCASRGPSEIHYGQDQCDYCKMTIADEKFGSELVTSKGKIYKFDSIECLAAYTHVNSNENASVNSMWVTDYSNAGIFVRVDSATIILSGQQNSPMGVGLMAISSNPQTVDFINEKGGRILNWSETCELVAKAWKL
jgi:copper chaperone NosL